MAEVKNSFIKSKMNKDLDARLIPNGEYREGVNIQVSRSEGADVGALENVLGNDILVDLSSPNGVYIPGLTTIGMYSDDTSNNIYIFLTDFTETKLSTISGDTQREYNVASLNYYELANNFIWVYNTVSREAVLLVKGSFLNFSTTNPILSVNLLEDLLFWTDNRNQPRRINVSFANDDAANKSPTYYVNEDQISVASYNPFEAIDLYYLNKNAYNTNGGQGTTITVSSGNTPDWTVSLNAGTLVGIDPSKLIGAAVTWTGQATGVYVVKSYGGNVLVIEGTPNPSLTVGTVLTFNQNLSSSVYVTSMLDVNSPKLPNKTTTNPDYNANYSGDPDYLEDKFVRFSYRFRFEDGEVSIMAPFTQAAFIPKQDGYFLNPDVEGTPEPVGNTTDESAAYRSTIVDFMENKVNQILMQIPLPVQGKSLSADYKVSEIEILYKESDAIATKVVDTILATGPQGFGNMPDPNNLTGEAIPRTTTFVEYNYQGVKPYKTLPKGDLTRVYDKVPVRALGQEVISNRIVYSNFQDKHTPPASLEFNVGIFDKKIFDIGSTGVARNKAIWYTSMTEYPMHTVKQNRNYQVGVVLSDRYGRSSTTILSSTQKQGTTLDLSGDVATYQGGTIYHPYTPVPAGGAATDVQSWPGDSIKVLFNQAIGFSGGGASELPNLQTYWPGLYNGDATSASYNPLGWYSYKIVVKQNEQEYYNVYLPGILNGYPDAPAEPADPANTINFITLFGDNINKVPADLTEVGPDQKQYRSGVQLYGRVTPRSKTVAPIVQSPAFNTQFYPGTASDTTIALANQNSMLEQPTATPPKTTYLDIYQTESNPPLGRVTQSDVTNPIGSNPQPVAITTAYNFLLGVYETEPVESAIDIFWETSTSGLISDLNEAINAEGDSIAGITTGNGGSTWVFNLYEDILPSNSGAVTSSSQSVNSDYSAGTYSSVSFYPYYSSGVGDNPQDTEITIDSVVDGIGRDRSLDFFIKRTGGSPDSYLIYPSKSFYFGQNASIDESYVFTLSITDGDPGPNNGQVSTVIAYGNLSNVAPKIENCVASFNPTAGASVLKTYIATNGSADVTKNKEDLTYTLTQTPLLPTLTIVKDANNDGVLTDDPPRLNGPMVVVVTVTDAGGATDTCTTALNGSIGYRTLPLNEDFYTSGNKSIDGGPFIVNKGTESSGFFWTSSPNNGINDPITNAFSSVTVPPQAMNRTPVGGLILPDALNITTTGAGTETLSQPASIPLSPGWEWINTNRTAAASVAFDNSSTNSRIDTLGAFAYNGELTYGPPIGLTKGTAYIIVDFESSILDGVALQDAPGYIWPVYLQYRPLNRIGGWQDALDIEGAPIVFGQTQVNNNTISNSGSSQFAQTGVISNREKSEFTVAANTYDKFNAAESYNYGRFGFGNNSRPVKAVSRHLFAFGQCQAYRDQTTFAENPLAPDQIGDYRLQVRWPNGRNQILKNGLYVDGGKRVTIGLNNSNAEGEYNNYTQSQESAQVKLQFGDFYRPFQLGYKQNDLSYAYRVSGGFSVDIASAEQLSISSSNVVYAREWAFRYVSRFYIDSILTIPWEPGETTLPSGATNPRYNTQNVDAYYRYTSDLQAANSIDGNDYSNVEKDQFTPFGKNRSRWTILDRSWVAKFTPNGKKILKTSIPLQVLDEGGGGGGTNPQQPTGSSLLLPDGVTDGSQNVTMNEIRAANQPVPFILTFRGKDTNDVTAVRDAAKTFASNLSTLPFDPVNGNVLSGGNVEFYNSFPQSVNPNSFTPVVNVTFNSFSNNPTVLTYLEDPGLGATITITNSSLNSPIAGGGDNIFWIVLASIQ